MRRWQSWILWLAPLATGFMVLAPERLQDRVAEQSVLDVALIYGIWRWGVPVALGLLLMAAVAGASLWRRQLAKAGRALVVVALGLVAIGAAQLWRARTPIWGAMPSNRYVAVEAAEFLTDADMVLGVTIGDVAVAYPSAIVAYHHIINDVVAGVPIAVTY